jgi:hypothetical protein
MLSEIFKKIIEISKKNSYWNLWIIILPALILGIYIYRKDVSINQGNYSIGLITKKYWPVISHESIMYSYEKNSKEYTNSAIYDDRLKPKVGKRYLIKYSLNYNFGGAQIFQGIEVPDSIKEAPKEGWKELPVWAVKNK